jgi:hypothetical protein
MYAWFKWATNQTGTGWLANGGIDAPNSWWERHTKVVTELFHIANWCTTWVFCKVSHEYLFITCRRNQNVGSSCMVCRGISHIWWSCSRTLLLMVLHQPFLGCPTLMPQEMLKMRK